jgi:hypothetical protein
VCLRRYQGQVQVSIKLMTNGLTVKKFENHIAYLVVYLAILTSTASSELQPSLLLLLSLKPPSLSLSPPSPSVGTPLVSSFVVPVSSLPPGILGAV